MNVRPCPACHGSTSVRIGSDASGFDTLIGGVNFQQPPYTIHCCDTCGLYFKSRTLPAEQLDDLYARFDSSTYEFDGNYPTDEFIHQALALLDDGARVLDFGCSTGRILKNATHRLQCFGVEPNQRAAALAAERGVHIIPEGRWSDDPSQMFDAVILADVYEHLADPMALVGKLAGQLKPGGLLVLVTGNADMITTRQFMSEFWYFRTVTHLHMLGDRHLSWLAQALGLTVARLHRCSHYRLSLVERIAESARSFAYFTFREAPSSAKAAALRLIPRVGLAEHWETAPALTGGRDHVVALLRKP